MYSVGNIAGGVAPTLNEITTMVNRTGATLTKGQVVSVNLDFASTSGQAMAGINNAGTDTDSSAGYVYGAAIVPTVANVLRRMAVVVSDSIVDNEYGLFCTAGIVQAIIDGANKGELLCGQAQLYLAPLTTGELADITADPRATVGIALEDSTGQQLKWIEFDGDAWKHFVSPVT